MHTSSDYFKQDYNSFNPLDEPYTPRSTVPFLTDTITKHKSTFPKVQDPILKPLNPSSTPAVEKIEKTIHQELAQLPQSKPNLDQLIQNALKQRPIQQQASGPPQRIISVKKASVQLPPVKAPPTPPQIPRQFFWPSEGARKPKLASSQTIKKAASSVVPVNLPQADDKLLSTPVYQDKIINKPQSSSFLAQALSLLDKQRARWGKHKAEAVTATPSPTITPSVPVKPIIQNPEPTGVINTPQPSLIAKTPDPLNPMAYFLFIINPQSDPYHDTHRKLIIYSLKVLGYLVILAGLFELNRNLHHEMNLNGFLEVISIFLISLILFYFGENLNLLIKPVSPYQVHEIV